MSIRLDLSSEETGQLAPLSNTTWHISIRLVPGGKYPCRNSSPSSFTTRGSALIMLPEHANFVATDDKPIRASGGHPFWVAGEGWKKARQLHHGDTLYGLKGTLAVRTVTPGDRETTYNLIVADFHTYFVGNARILSHDNTIRQPTSTIVPGLANR